MNRNSVYIRVLLIILAVVAFVAFIDRTPHHTVHDAWLPSSLNPAGSGTMALYDTLDDLHWPVARWREPLSRLSDAGTGNALIITRSSIGWRVAFTDQEVGLLDDWVQKGNTLLLFGAFDQWDDTREILRRFNFNLPENNGPTSLTDLLAPFSGKPNEKIILQPGPDNSGAVIFPRTNSLPVSFPKGSHILWQSQGIPFVLEIPRGHGRVVCASSAQWLSKNYLDQGDNLPALIQILAPGGQPPHRLLFEESHHGFSSIYAVVRLLDQPGIRVGGMLAVLGLVAFLGSSLMRFGPIVPLHRDTGRSTLEFVDSIADLYQRADLRNDHIAYLFHETHQRILQRLHLPPTASHDVIAARLQQSHPELPSWKKLARRFDSPDDPNSKRVLGLPPSGWLRVALELIQIKSAMV